MSAGQALLTVGIGVFSGVLSGLFGVGGGIVMTPALDWLLPIRGIEALETPLPVIFPTSITAAMTYRKAGQVDVSAARWMSVPGLVGAVIGALLTQVVDTALLLLITALLLAYQSVSILRGSRLAQGTARTPRPLTFVTIGWVAGFASGLLGLGGGLVMVPLLAGWLGMPLKRALGTSLLTIPALVIPGTIVHALLGNIDWGVFVFLTVGAVPGARLGASIALGARERTLRLAVGSFMLLVALGYGVAQLVDLFRA